MNIIRAYKLSLLGIGKNPLPNDLILFLDSKLKRVTRFETIKYPNRVFYFNQYDEDILELTLNSSLLVRYSGLWSVLEKNYLLEEKEIQDLIRFWIEKENIIDLTLIKISSYFMSSAYSIKYEYRKYNEQPK